MRLVSVKIPGSLVDELDSLARILGTTRSELIRRALACYAEKLNRELHVEPAGRLRLES